MRAQAGLAAGFPTMRSSLKLQVRPHLLRVFSPTHKALLSGAGGQGFAATATVASATPHPLSQLGAAVRYEQEKGLQNVQGRYRTFSETLVDTLKELSRSAGLSDERRQAVPALLLRAQGYATMTAQQRGELLRLVEATLGLQAPNSYPSNGSQNARRHDEYATVRQQQETYRQWQRQQRQQQPSPAAMPPPQQQHLRRQRQAPPQQQHLRWQRQAPPQQQQQQRGGPASATSAGHASKVAGELHPPQPTTPQRSRPQLAPAAAQVAAPPSRGPAACQASKGGAAQPASSAGVSSLRLPEGWVEPSEYQPPASWTQVVPILFDLETTGRSTTNNCIVEIAARQLDTGEEFSSFLRLEPGEEMMPDAALATSLSTRFLREARHPPRREVLRMFYGWVQLQLARAAPGAVLLLVGHNITRFDCKVLNRHLEEAGLPPLPHARLLDTLPLARGVLPNLNKHTLQNLALHFKELAASEVQSHRALDDVLLNEAVLRHLMRVMGEEGTTWGMFLAKDQHAHLFSPAGIAWMGQVDWRAGRNLKAAKPRLGPQRSPADVKLHRGFQAVSQGQPAAAAVTAAELSEPVASPGAETVAGQLTGTEAGEAGEGAPPAWDTEEGVMAGFIYENEDSSIPGVDPLVELEEEGVAGPGLAPQTYGDLLACRSAWQKLLSQEEEGKGPLVQRSFLDSPLKNFSKGEAKFTKKPLGTLGAGGIATLSELLEYYPKDYRSAVPGQLPAEGEGAVCLAVKLVGDAKVLSSGSLRRLVATLEVIPPGELGLPTPPAAAAAGSQANGAAGTMLKLAKFGYSFWALNLTKAALDGLAGGGVVFGRVKQTGWDGGGEWELVGGEVEVVPLDQARELFSGGGAKVEPIYSACGDLTGKQMAKHVATALAILEASPSSWQDPLPPSMLEEEGLVGFLEAVKGLHQPQSLEQLEECRRRLAFQELLALQLRLLLQRHLFRLPDREEQMQGVHIHDYSLVERAITSLPYQLTGGQQQALRQLRLEMGAWPPMMCLLQGDVGCGKTIVAFLALLAAAGSGYQGCIMAPTEILAEQHFANLQRLLGQMAGAAEGEAGPRMPTIALLTGSVLGKERNRIYGGLADGSIDLVVGTHALLTKAVQFSKLGLAVVDEQHRFGVAQRSKLRDKSCPSPHVLYMTATPIPRTSALVLHGDMSQIVIDDMPPGRTQVATHAVLDSEAARHEVYQHMQREITQGGQAYIICPLVEESEKEGLAEVKAATQERGRLVAEGILRENQCGLLHGQLKSAEKEAALRAFASGATPVLISTTVVEVGVDVPAASLILVEHADRFGLAQLHQLRGRVGRGARPSTCYLFADKPDNMERLRVMEKHHSGFHVAEADLWIRGPGEVLGTSQSGKENLSALKVCKLPQDRDLVPRARQAAARYLSAQSVVADPSSWHPELLSLVCSKGLPQLDLKDIKAAE